MNPPSQTSDAKFMSFYSNRCVCVTGGAGFIGSHLCEALVHHGAIVTAIDDLSNGLRENLLSIQHDERPRRARRGLRFINGSILDHQKLSDAMTGAEKCSKVVFQAVVREACHGCRPVSRR